MLDTYRQMFEYNEWANRNIIDALSGIQPAELTKPRKSTFPSIKDTLIHILSSEWVWLQRWKGYTPELPLNSKDFPTFRSLQSCLDTVSEEQREFIDALDNADLFKTLSIINLKGENRSYLLWQTMMHVICHSNYHRGEINTMICELNGSPVATDLLAYEDLLKDSREETLDGFVNERNLFVTDSNR